MAARKSKPEPKPDGHPHAEDLREAARLAEEIARKLRAAAESAAEPHPNLPGVSTRLIRAMSNASALADAILPENFNLLDDPANEPSAEARAFAVALRDRERLRSLASSTPAAQFLALARETAAAGIWPGPPASHPTSYGEEFLHATAKVIGDLPGPSRIGHVQNLLDAGLERPLLIAAAASPKAVAETIRFLSDDSIKALLAGKDAWAQASEGKRSSIVSCLVELGFVPKPVHLRAMRGLDALRSRFEAEYIEKAAAKAAPAAKRRRARI